MDDNSYTVTVADGSVQWACVIPTSSPSVGDQLDFETNFKTSGNLAVGQTIVSQPPYGAKTVTVNGVVHKLFSRMTGLQYSVSTGANTITYTATYPWTKLIGVEVVNCEALDTADFIVYDTPGGTYSGVPNQLLQQFSYTLNMPKDFYIRMAQFDADLYQGMVIQINYTSVSNKTIGINLLMNQVV